MLSSRSMLRTSFATLALTASLGLAGCDQEQGAPCQIDGDCASGLECNASTKTCLPKGTTVGDDGDAGIDAPLDAAEIDAADIDAAVDAPLDAGACALPTRSGGHFPLDGVGSDVGGQLVRFRTRRA